MDQSIMNAIGPALVLAISCIGCCIGCAISGLASHAAMARTEEGHGKFIGMSAAPSSQTIYGCIMTLMLQSSIAEGSVSAAGGIAIGTLVGLAFAFSSIFQGMVCAAGIQATAKNPAVYGKCFTAIGIIESFALFAFVFSLALL